MNILPKKRWHVRTKENIARVRRDEAHAAEQAKIEQARIDKAESEARIHFLRNESRQKNVYFNSDKTDIKLELAASTSKKSSKHINFFEELEQGIIDHSKPNKDYEKNKREELEKYEKQIGYLTYLGQGIQEAVNKSWYNEVPKRLNDTEKNIEVKANKKYLEDPIQDIKKYMNIISLNKGKNKSDVKSKTEELKFETNKPKNADINKKKRKRLSSESDSSDGYYKSKKKHKKHKKHKKSKKHKHKKKKEIVKSTVSIEKLREERLNRERQEKLRTAALLAEVNGKGISQGGNVQTVYRQKYNSQFFPELARQNFDKIFR